VVESLRSYLDVTTQPILLDDSQKVVISQQQNCKLARNPDRKEKEYE